MHHPTDDDLILHVYGEHAPAERARIDEHLTACEACQGAWDEINRTLTIADAAAVPEPPEGFERLMWARVSAALPEARPRSIWTWRALVPLTSLAALMVAAVVLGRFWPGADAPVTAEQMADANDANKRAARVSRRSTATSHRRKCSWSS
jgi:anti-sigma factor RsiW